MPKIIRARSGDISSSCSTRGPWRAGGPCGAWSARGACCRRPWRRSRHIAGAGRSAAGRATASSCWRSPPPLPRPPRPTTAGPCTASSGSLWLAETWSRDWLESSWGCPHSSTTGPQSSLEHSAGNWCTGSCSTCAKEKERGMNEGRKERRKEGRKCFIYGHMVSNIW